MNSQRCSKRAVFQRCDLYLNTLLLKVKFANDLLAFSSLKKKDSVVSTHTNHLKLFSAYKTNLS